MTWRIEQADCIEAMRELDECSVDAVVCDPPYGLGFMGHEWDQPSVAVPEKREGVPSGQRRRAQPKPSGFDNEGGGAKEVGRYDLSRSANHAFQCWSEAWATQALRILKPGGHLLAFGGTRTYHRLACAVEDAGFEIRDSLIWLYGSGFPKSLDVSKAIDKAAGIEREVIERRPAGAATGGVYGEYAQEVEISEPATPEAQRWQGWGTALKPAHEPIVVARKPLAGTVAANVTEHGTGALNVDGCRIGSGEGGDHEGEATAEQRYTDNGSTDFAPTPGVRGGSASGRWPSNVALSHLPECERVGETRVPATAHYKGGGEHYDSEGLFGVKGHVGESPADEDGLETVEAWECATGCPVAELDRQSGELTSGKLEPHHYRGQPRFQNTYGDCEGGIRATDQSFGGDTGGASRFFYVAKASRAERSAGLDGSVSGHSKIGPCRCPKPPVDTQPPRATDGAIVGAECDSSTTGSGSKSTGRSPTAIKSTTETRTRPTTGSRTSNSSPRPSTSDSTPSTTAEPMTEAGSDAAPSAESGSPRTASTTTSASRAGSSTDAADPVTSPASSLTSNGDADLCPDCGGVSSGALRNSHPT